ncbi:MAG: glycosyltransferase family 4 protein [Verrucomicrobia bacterium]|jgi:glycosyltransferase involved in cell wall biosynthesis|nr:glycosyltransferase family 4 protein [Verrucomicrobiota bacterium]
MKIVQITPGAGGMYCGGCFRDNALVKCLRDEGHEVLMVPLYLPLTLEDADQSSQTPIFFGGINVFLDQTLGLFRKLPVSWTSWLDKRSVLKRISKYAARTRPEDVGDLTVSMLMGEEGRQQKELDQLVDWLKENMQPDVVCLSNALLIGMVRQIKDQLGCAVACTLQGEDTFLDALPADNRRQAWDVLSTRAREVDAFITPSQYFGELMQQRMGFDISKLHIIPNGIPTEGYTRSSLPMDPPVLGYFARMCREKGLPLLVDAFIRLKSMEPHQNLRLMVGGGMGPSDEPVVDEQKKKLQSAGVAEHVTWHPNLDREEKLDFFSKLTIFSVPALYGETFGLYLLEAMAAGVPVVQPPHAAFPEVIEATAGGIIATGLEAGHLAESISSMLGSKDDLKDLSDQAYRSVHEGFKSSDMAKQVLAAYQACLPH